MLVEPVDEFSSLFRWVGEFEPLGMSEESCIAFTESVYAAGIGMMIKTVNGCNK